MLWPRKENLSLWSSQSHKYFSTEAGDFPTGHCWKQDRNSDRFWSDPAYGETAGNWVADDHGVVSWALKTLSFQNSHDDDPKFSGDVFIPLGCLRGTESAGPLPISLQMKGQFLLFLSLSWCHCLHQPSSPPIPLVGNPNHSFGGCECSLSRHL